MRQTPARSMVLYLGLFLALVIVGQYALVDAFSTRPSTVVASNTRSTAATRSVTWTSSSLGVATAPVEDAVDVTKEATSKASDNDNDVAEAEAEAETVEDSKETIQAVAIKSIKSNNNSNNNKKEVTAAVTTKSEETEEEEENLMDKIKESGVAGIISYAAWETAFWAASVPVCVLGYKEVTGHWPDIGNKDDVSKLGAEAFAFVNFARFAVPLRIGLALGTTPWIQENVVDKYGIGRDDVNDVNDDVNDNETEPTKKIVELEDPAKTMIAEAANVAAEVTEDPAIQETVAETTIVIEQDEETETKKTQELEVPAEEAIAAETNDDTNEEVGEEPEAPIVATRKESRFRVRSRVRKLVTRVVKRNQSSGLPDCQDISTAIANELQQVEEKPARALPDCQDIGAVIANELQQVEEKPARALPDCQDIGAVIANGEPSS